MECDDQNGEEKVGLVEYNNFERNKSSPPPPFLLKTCMLVEDPSTDEIISWNEDGTAFVVWQPAEFSRDLLPTVFKHSNFSSFVRQLNTYGFRKVATDRWEFKNDMFRRGKGDQLCGIRRRKPCSSISNKPNPNSTNTPQAQLEHRKHGDHHHHIIEQDQRTSSTTSSSELAILLDENKRLRQENGALSSELTEMKKKCKELSDLVATYGSKSTDGDDMEEEFEVEDGCNNSTGLKLFGVRLQVKGEIDHYQKDDYMSES